jgi:hypothetical protein
MDATLASSPTVAQSGHETGGGTPDLNRLLLLFLVLFWTNGMSVIRVLHTGWVIDGFNGASARTLLEPFWTTDASESYLINSLNRATLQLEARFF